MMRGEAAARKAEEGEDLFVLLSAAEGGTYLQSTADELRKIGREVQETGKAGKLVITIELAHAGVSRMKASVTNKTTLPKGQVESFTIFMDDDGNLTRRSHKRGQPELRLDAEREEKE